jgi:hypothetical protein
MVVDTGPSGSSLPKNKPNLLLSFLGPVERSKEGLFILAIKSMTNVSTFFLGLISGPLLAILINNATQSSRTVELPKVIITYNNCDALRFKDQEKGNYFYLTNCLDYRPSLIQPFTSSQGKALIVVDSNGFTR